jgi:Cu/Zn superoxide dismutase
MSLILAMLASLCTCCAAEVRKAMAVLYESSDQKGSTSSLNMVGIVEFSQAGPFAKLMIAINLFSDAKFTNGLHGFHIHQMGRSWV